MNSSFATIKQDLKLHYFSWSGTDPSILFVHGLASNARMFEGVANLLEDQGIKSVSVDQRGHGQSDKPKTGYDYSTICSDLDEFINKMKRHNLLSKKPLLVGQSWGCSVVQNYASLHPEKTSGLVLIDGGFHDMKSEFPTWEECYSVLRPPDFTNMSAESFRLDLVKRISEFPATSVEAIMANFYIDANTGLMRPNLPFEQHIAILHELYHQSPDHLVSTLEVPLVFITALSNDPKVIKKKHDSINSLLKLAKVNSHAYWIEGHHDLHAQYPEKIAAIIKMELDQGVLTNG